MVLAGLLTALPGGSQRLVPAFPGAEGAGANATGGRGGSVYRVANLNASGPGSLADAVSQGDRFVVFGVSGEIDLAGKSIRIDHPNVTIAGQTAPGEGITLIHGGLRIAAGNVIVRHIRARRGMIRKGDMGDAITIKGQFENVIVDHVSATWATDENLTLTNANNVTAQYAIIAEGLDYFNPPQTPQRHAFGSLFGSAFDDGRMTIHHSLYAHNRLRNARTTAGGRVPPVLDFRNNVIYDAKEATSHTGSEAVYCNWVANYYKDGPSTGIEGRREEVSRVIFQFHSPEKHKLYLEGNYLEGSPERSRNNWDAVSAGRRGKVFVRFEDVRINQPLPSPPVTTQTAIEAYDAVLEEAGATLPSRDVVDARIVRDVRNGSGAVINFETDIPEAGRTQRYHSLPAPADTDHDGMPDYWERQFKFDPVDPGDAMRDADHDGYTNLEEYVNNTDPRGGERTIVFVSASEPRAYRDDRAPAEIRFHRTGNLDGSLLVRYSVDGGNPKAITFAVGAKFASLPIQADTRARGSDGLIAVDIVPASYYSVGVPDSAVVAVLPGNRPQPVRVRDIDPGGGATPADLAEAERVNREHEGARKRKVEERRRLSVDPKKLP